MMQPSLPGLDGDSLGCETARRLRGEGRIGKDSAEGSAINPTGDEAGLARGRATTDARAGGRAEESARQGYPPADDLGQGGGSDAGKRSAPSTRARPANSPTNTALEAIREQARRDARASSPEDREERNRALTALVRHVRQARRLAS